MVENLWGDVMLTSLEGTKSFKMTISCIALLKSLAQGIASAASASCVVRLINK